MIWRIYLQKARNANAKGNIEEAIINMDKMLKFSPSVEAKVLYGYYLLKKNRIDKAKTVFEQYIMNDKRVTRAPVYNKKGKLKLNRKEMLAKTNYALLLWKTGDIDGAISLLEYVHKRMRTTDLYCNLGYLYILKGDLEKALSYNLRAYDFSPESNGICDNLGYTYYCKGEMEKAKQIYEEIMHHEKKPSFPECWYNYGKVLEYFGETEKAASMYEHALQLEFTGFSNVTSQQVEQALKNLPQKVREEQ